MPPFYDNVDTRLIKSPKVYVADSGLACHLLGMDSARDVARSPFLGPLFEGFIDAEIVKAQINSARRPEIYYFRDEHGLEVEFLVPGRRGGISLVERKAARTATPTMAWPMQRLGNALKKKRLQGGVIEMSLVHQLSSTTTTTTAIMPGVQAVSWPSVIQTL